MSPRSACAVLTLAALVAFAACADEGTAVETSGLPRAGASGKAQGGGAGGSGGPGGASGAGGQAGQVAGQGGAAAGGQAGASGAASGQAGASGAAAGGQAGAGQAGQAGTGGASQGGAGQGGGAGAVGGMMPGGSGQGGSSGGPGGAPACAVGGEKFSYTVTDNEPNRLVELPLAEGVEYQRLVLEFDFTPGPWGETCFNPASKQGSGYPKAELLVAVQHGSHWCKGGNVFETILHGPAPGHGASEKAITKSFFKPEVWKGSGCGESSIEADIFSGKHGATPSSPLHAKVVYDMVTRTLTTQLGPVTLSGPLAEGLSLKVAPGQPPWFAVFSFGGGYIECYNEQGQHDETQPCCWGPSLGWQFSDLSWEACP